MVARVLAHDLGHAPALEFAFTQVARRNAEAIDEGQVGVSPPPHRANPGGIRLDHLAGAAQVLHREGDLRAGPFLPRHHPALGQVHHRFHGLGPVAEHHLRAPREGLPLLPRPHRGLVGFLQGQAREAGGRRELAAFAEGLEHGPMLLPRDRIERMPGGLGEEHGWNEQQNRWQPEESGHGTSIFLEDPGSYCSRDGRANGASVRPSLVQS